MGKQLRVAVLSGGRGGQRELSLASGICIAAALEEAGHRAYGVDPAEVELAEIDWRRFDACFFALPDDDKSGSTRRLLNDLRVPCTGSGPLAVARAMSKSATKERLASRGVPMPRSTVLHTSEPIGRLVARAERLGYPLVVKPDGQGASLGVGIAHSRDQLESCIAQAQFFDEFLLAEQYVPGREFAVCFLNEQMLPPLEVLLDGELFSHEMKSGDAVEYTFESGLPSEQVRRLGEVGRAAVEAMGCTGLVRIDMRLDRHGGPWVLELNTSPELTERSTAARAAAQAGIGLPSLCDRLLRDCLPVETHR